MAGTRVGGEIAGVLLVLLLTVGGTTAELTLDTTTDGFEISFQGNKQHAPHDQADSLAKAACHLPEPAVRLPVSKALIKRILREEAREDLSLRTDAERPNSVSIPHYDWYRGVWALAVKGIFQHTLADPVVWLGSGVANFSEWHGNFQVEDEVLVKIPLSQYTEVTVQPDLIQLTLTSEQDPTLSFDLVVSEFSETQVDISSTAAYTGATYNRIWVRVWAEEKERVWGAGEQYTYLNLRGRHYPIWTTEQGVGRDGGIIANMSDQDLLGAGDYYTTYWPQASFLSSRRYSLLIPERHYLVFNFTEAERHDIYIHNDVIHATLLQDTSLMKTVQGVTTILQPQPQLPDWVITGTILGLQRGTDEMLFYYEAAKNAGANVSALWIQDWSGSIQTAFGSRVYWNWRWNQISYPDLDEVIQYLSEEGVQVMVYLNPHLIEDSEMFNEAAALGHLLTDDTGEAFRQDFGGFLAGTVDLFNPASYAWYRDQMITNMVDLGIAGWMADFGEYTRLDMYSQDTQYDDEERHNLLPVEWARCNKEVVESSGKLGEIIPFMRSGGLGSSTHQLLSWEGDQNVNWDFGDGLPSTVVAALSLAVSGMGVTHFDIGGYTTQAPVLKRSKELLLRSTEYAVFTPVMRTHEGNRPDSNHQFYSDEDTLLQFSRLTQMHARLQPYTRALLQALKAKGTPVQRPLFLDFEADIGTWDINYQYMYGPDLLVAPILYKGEDTQTTYLPGGASWVHLWGDGSVTPGPSSVTVSAPMGYPPVFYRQDSVWTSLFQEISQEFGSSGRWAVRQ